jgi:hypothetical protein
MVKICKDCGQEFELTEKEEQWFIERKLVPPARCKSCRNKRKAVKRNKKEVKK